MNFVIPIDYKLKMKVSGKIDIYLDITRELKKLRNKRAMVISVAIGMLGMVPKDF